MRNKTKLTAISVTLILATPFITALDINSTTPLRYFPGSNMQFKVDTNGNVEIPNGNLDISENEIHNFNTLRSATSGNPSFALSGGDIYFNTGGGGSDFFTILDQSQSGNPSIFKVNEGGNVNIPKGSLNVGSQGQLKLNDQSGEAFPHVSFQASGTLQQRILYYGGGNQLEVEDGAGNNLMLIQDGGNVNIPNGDLFLDQNSLQMYATTGDDHALTSDDYSGSNADDIRVNSLGAYYVNLDSNSSNANNADFIVGHHGGTGTISEDLLRVREDTGNVEIPNGNLDVSSPSNSDHTVDVGGSMGVEGNLDMNGNNITSSGGEMCIGQYC